MNKQIGLLIALIAPALCPAKPAPYAVRCALLDRIAQVAQTGSRTGQIALELLKRVAGGRTGSINAESEAELGLKLGELQHPDYKVADVRAHALRRIGESNLPEALNYLKSMKPGDLQPDDSQQVWPAAQIALHEALLNKVPNPQAKIEFLENTLTEPHDAISNSAVVTWAANELCDGRALTSLPLIQQSIKKRDPFPSGEEEVQFCEARIRVVSHDPDRVKALSSILRVDGGLRDPRLTMWAINQLASIHSAKADAELDRFGDEIRRLPEESPQKQQLFTFSQNIHDLRAERLQ